MIFTIVVGVIMYFFSFAIYYLSEDHRENDFTLRLKESAIVKLKLLDSSSGFSNSTDLKNQFENSAVLSNEKILIYNSDFKVLYADSIILPLNEIKEKLKDNREFKYKTNRIDIIGFDYNYKDENFIILASATDTQGISYINFLKKLLVVRGGIIVIIIIISGWLYAGSFLKPIADIVDQTNEITDTNLNKRLDARNTKDEVGKLTSTLNQMLERIEVSFKAQKRFISNASHEMRNPLTAINGQIEVALIKDRENQEYKAILESISVDIKELILLVNNLLDLANSDVLNLTQNFGEIRIDEVLWSIQEDLTKKNSACKIKIDFEHLPDNERELVCKGEEKLLKTAFKNIIDNACKFSNNQQVSVRITFLKDHIKISVMDKGIGIPESYFEHIFEPFHRAGNAARIPGNGVGLTLVQKIIKIHGGKLVVKSKLGEGTTVEIELPKLT